MRKLLKGFATEQEAMNYSSSIFPDKTSSQTQYSYGWRKNPNGTDWALEIDTQNLTFLPQEKINELVDDDWVITQQPEFNEFGQPMQSQIGE